MFKNLLNIKKYSKKYFFTNFENLKQNKKIGIKLCFLLGGLISYSKLNKLDLNAKCWFSRMYTNDSKNRVNYLQYAANNPIEDKYIFGNLESVPGFVSGVFDGHGGWQVCKLKSKICFRKFSASY